MGKYIEYTKTETNYIGISGKFLKEKPLFIFLIILAIIGAVILGYIILQHTKLAMIWMLFFSIIFLTRRTDAWKIGIEIHNFAVFVLTYVYGIIFALSVAFLALIAVIRARPDEVNGAVINAICFGAMAFLTTRLASIYGTRIHAETFVFLALVVIIFGLALDTVLALKIAPVHWIKLIVNHTMDVFINYIVITAFGYQIYLYLLKG